MQLKQLSFAGFLINSFFLYAVNTKKPPVIQLNPFYKAMCQSHENDLEFIKQNIDNYSFQELKKVLCAQPLPNKKIPIYVHMHEDYYQDQAYEPFGNFLQKFPPPSASLLAKLLITSIKATITKRENHHYGTAEIKWLKEELQSLKFFCGPDSVLHYRLENYRLRAESF